MKERILVIVVLLAIGITGCGQNDDNQNYKESKRLAKLITETSEEKLEIQELIEQEEKEIATIKKQKEEFEDIEDTEKQANNEIVVKEEKSLLLDAAEAEEDTEKTIEKITANYSVSVPYTEMEEKVPNIDEEVKVENIIPVHEHIWEQQFVEYDLIQEHIYGCNGCGFPLFTRTNTGVQFIDDLYFHPPCATDRFEGACTGGGFHSEYYTAGYCAKCGEKVSFRQCMWTENGKRCIKNEADGPYEKVEYDQNYFMYFDVCGCGSNSICESGVQPQKGLILDKKICSICGMEKTE